VTDDDVRVSATELKQRLTHLETQLARELTARGFDPAQRANIPIPSGLSKLFIEIETVRNEIESSSEKENE